MFSLFKNNIIFSKQSTNLCKTFPLLNQHTLKFYFGKAFLMAIHLIPFAESFDCSTLHKVYQFLWNSVVYTLHFLGCSHKTIRLKKIFVFKQFAYNRKSSGLRQTIGNIRVMRSTQLHCSKGFGWTNSREISGKGWNWQGFYTSTIYSSGGIYSLQVINQQYLLRNLKSLNIHILLQINSLLIY